mgnify:CR=1 FL=1
MHCIKVVFILLAIVITILIFLQVIPLTFPIHIEENIVIRSENVKWFVLIVVVKLVNSARHRQLTKLFLDKAYEIICSP